LKKELLSALESSQAPRRAAAALVPDDASDRFSRAETAYERRMYRALGMLVAIREAAGRGVKLPELPE